MGLYNTHINKNIRDNTRELVASQKAIAESMSVLIEQNRRIIELLAKEKTITVETKRYL